jgi:hypothetical protein
MKYSGVEHKTINNQSIINILFLVFVSVTGVLEEGLLEDSCRPLLKSITQLQIVLNPTGNCTCRVTAALMASQLFSYNRETTACTVLRALSFKLFEIDIKLKSINFQ